MARTKTIEELKKEQKTLADLIKKKEKELQDNALKKAGKVFLNSLSKMAAEKSQEHIDKMELNKDELGFIKSTINKLKEKRKKEDKKAAQTSSPTAHSINDTGIDI